jgi:hypothetical protein
MDGTEAKHRVSECREFWIFNGIIMKMDLTMVKRATTLKGTAKKPAPIPLVKGQLWKMDDKHIEIMEVGKTLTHYRLFQSQKRVPISLGGIAAVQAYLKTNGAKLIRKPAPAKAA